MGGERDGVWELKAWVCGAMDWMGYGRARDGMAEFRIREMGGNSGESARERVRYNGGFDIMVPSQRQSTVSVE